MDSLVCRYHILAEISNFPSPFCFLLLSFLFGFLFLWHFHFLLQSFLLISLSMLLSLYFFLFFSNFLLYTPLQCLYSPLVCVYSEGQHCQAASVAARSWSWGLRQTLQNEEGQYRGWPAMCRWYWGQRLVRRWQWRPTHEHWDLTSGRQNTLFHGWGRVFWARIMWHKRLARSLH